MNDEHFLNVECSLSGRRWVSRPTDDRQALALAQRLDAPEIIGRILNARGIGLDEAESFLEPTLKELLPDPLHLKDMEVAVERLATAVMQGERIAVFGDYDVDGATSSALLLRYFRAVGGRASVYIPDRIKEGYGPNENAMIKLKDEGASVVVTVDCGTTSHVPLLSASEAGLDVIVIDHHEAEARLPKATAIVNPNRLDEDSPYGHMAAVGVSFLLVVGLNRGLRQAGWFESRPEPNLMQWLDLVALGTICDVVSLTGVNRALVKQGLKVLSSRSNAGLTALADVAGIDEPPGAYHAGYVLGPRINAGGRVGESWLGARLLGGDDKAEASEIAAKLDAYNRERQDIEAQVQAEALDLLETAEEGDYLTFVAGKGWHPGVVGIVASRLKDLTHKPTLVIGINEGKGQGSGRSVKGVDLGAAIIAARQSGLLEKGGGHAMAAGLTVAEEKIDELKAFLEARLADAMKGIPLLPGLSIDGGLMVSGANMELASLLERIGPYGSGNPEPRFVIPRARIAHAAPVGKDQNHLRLTLADEGGGKLNAIAFRVVETDLGQALLRHDGAPFHIAGKLRINTWMGKSSAQLLVDDAAPVW